YSRAKVAQEKLIEDSPIPTRSSTPPSSPQLVRGEGDEHDKPGQDANHNGGGRHEAGLVQGEGDTRTPDDAVHRQDCRGRSQHHTTMIEYRYQAARGPQSGRWVAGRNGPHREAASHSTGGSAGWRRRR